MAHTINCRTDGTVDFIWADELKPLAELGPVAIRRVSHVEPAGPGTDWAADMSPVGGPVLGPFPTRQEALDAEVDYLKATLGY